MKWLIEGPESLVGSVKVSGSKNSALKIIVASLFANDDVIIDNVPRIENVMVDLEIISHLGAKVEWLSQNRLLINSSSIFSNEIPYETGSQYRTTALLAAPLLYRFGKVSIPKQSSPGSVTRPINRWIDTWKAVGFTVHEDEKYYHIALKTPSNSEIKFKVLSVMGTENAILSTMFIPGESVIFNASSEPEIDDLIEFVNVIGGNVKRVDERKIIIHGTQSFKGGKFKVMPDRLEAATFATLGIASCGDINVEGVTSSDLLPFVRKLEQMGANFEFRGDSLRVWRTKGDKLKAVNVETSPAPGFITDWQPLVCILMTQAEGTSYIHDTVYVDRLSYTKELNRMGAKISLLRPSDVGFQVSVSDDTYDVESMGEPYTVAKIDGPTLLRREKLNTPDLKAGASLIMAAIIAEGRSEIHGVENVLKGYENFEEKLRSLGAKITKID